MSASPSAATAAPCSFCDHRNPGDAKFCNECGSPLDLRPCIRCHAINQAAALHCHACGMAFHAELQQTDGAPDGAAHRGIARLRRVAGDRRLAATGAAIVAALVAGIGFPLLEPASESTAERVLVESSAAAPDAALRAMDDATAASAPLSSSVTASEPSSPPQDEAPQPEVVAEAPAPAPVLRSEPARSAQSGKGSAAKRGSTKSKSSNRAAPPRKPTRPKNSAASVR
jgi:hypothetical protein